MRNLPARTGEVFLHLFLVMFSLVLNAFLVFFYQQSIAEMLVLRYFGSR